MTKTKITKLARKAVKDGPVVIRDNDGNPYFAYVMVLREGFKFRIIDVDENLPGDPVSVLVKEAMRSSVEFGL